MRFKHLAICAAVFAGGLSVPAVAYDTPPELMMVVPPAPKGKGMVVFYRSATIIGGGISCAVSENSKKISSMGVGRYFVYAAEPGKHSFSVSSEAKDTVTLELEADEVQYVGCRIKMGIMAGRPDLFPAKEADFRANKKLSLSDPKTYGEGVLKPEEIAALAGVTIAAPAAAH
ncbi:DUF2846 domain-containing protein [Novosphingobium sp. KACC 22771]|uniref:DUF2846 domain-containing protein n=1 Tax=Novosphingobium sp. KACC 22771 TaxID=3025670 RepID=UPI0023654DD6|nr:DUF2846 domain-containing protein [Novosphingobium sp. KACC 22771]WDF71255.1 DUF2846 domain-containing protein [Novosphingobium sp. KACC 22771]